MTDLGTELGMGPALLTAAWAMGTVLLLAWRRLRTDLVALLSLAVGTVLGLVPADGLGTGFSAAPALVVAAAGVTAIALERSGLTAWPARLGARRNPPGVLGLAGLGAMGALGAALYGRQGTRRALLPAVSGGPSALPLRITVELACVLGSGMTLIGGLPNLLAAELRRRSVGQPFAVLDFLPVGGVVGLAGVVLVAVTVARTLARGRRDAASGLDVDTDTTTVRTYVSEVRAAPGAAVVGRSVAALEAAEEGGLRVAGIVREEFRRFEPRPDWHIEPGDVLVLDCEPAVLQRWMERYGVQLVGGGGTTGQVGVAEAVITPASPLVGRTGEEARLGEQFGLHLLAIGRNGPGPAGRLRRTKLRPGDVLVLQGRLEPMDSTLLSLGCLKLAERQLRLGGARPNVLPILLLLGALACAAAGVVPLWLALLGCVLLLAAVLSPMDVYAAVPWSSIVRVGALLPLSGALTDSGAAAVVGGWLAPVATGAGLPGMVAALLVASMAAAALLGQVPAVLLLAPVALALAAAVAATAGDALLLAVALGASVNAWPLRDGGGAVPVGGWQTRLAVSLLALVIGTVLIPAVWGGR